MANTWIFDDIQQIFSTPILDLVYKAAEIHRKHHDPREVQVCHLISIKTGGCTEDCQYCAQSAQYSTFVKPTALMELDEILAKTKAAQSRGVTRVCLGMAQREIKNGNQFEKVLEIVRALADLNVEICCTMGMLDESQALRLKEAGAFAYNHNLDTSREFYPQIITTRTYEERLKTLDVVEKSQLQVCCGGIIGLGETREDRIKLLLELGNRHSPPESVPINLLHPVKGTPLGDAPPPPKWEVVRMIATARICMPKSKVRLTAGRDSLSTEIQAFCFLAGANSIFIGEKLLTVSNPSYDADEAMFAELGLYKKEGSQ